MFDTTSHNFLLSLSPEVVKLLVSLLYSHSVLSKSFWPRGLQHTGLPCPSTCPRACSNSGTFSQWRHPTILSSVIPFYSCLQSFPASSFFSNGSVLCIRWPKYWRFSFNISHSYEYSGLIYFRLTGLISLQSKGLSRVFSNTTVQKHQFFSAQPSLLSTSHFYTWLLEKNIVLTGQTFVHKIISLLFNILSKFFIAFLSKSRRLLIWWL